MRYRIVKKSYRNESTGEIKAYFQPQYEGRTLWRDRPVWVDFQEVASYGSDSYSTARRFNTEKDALKFVKNYEQEIPEDKCVYLTK